MGQHRRIQGGSSWEDPGWVIMGGSRVGQLVTIQRGSLLGILDGLLWVDPGWVIVGGSKVHCTKYHDMLHSIY